MNVLINKKKKLIGQRIKSIRLLLGVTHEIFGKACNLSPGTIVTIESGKKGYIFDSLLNITYFLGIELEDIVSQAFKIPTQEKLREQIKTFHVAHHSKAYLLLQRNPRISRFIRDQLLTTDFLNKPKMIREIIQYCKEEFNISLKGPSVTNAMKTFKKEGLVRIFPSNRKDVFLYQKVRK